MLTAVPGAWRSKIKKRLRGGELRWRRLTAAYRRLPDFLILGAQKAGTTSLFDYVCQHPQVCPPFHKEVHYFDLSYRRGLAWYRAHFSLSGKAAHSLTGEASPYYLYHPRVAERVARDLPEAKLLVLLRNPVDRAYSHYRFNQRWNNVNAPTFLEAIDREPELIRPEKERMRKDPAYQSYALQHYSYLDRGNYAVQLRHWFRHVDRSRFLILKSEDLFQDPEPTMQKVFSFLGLTWPGDLLFRQKNATAYDPLEESMLHRLRAYYQQSVDELTALLGPDFRWW